MEGRRNEGIIEAISYVTSVRELVSVQSFYSLVDSGE